MRTEAVTRTLDRMSDVHARRGLAEFLVVASLLVIAWAALPLAASVPVPAASGPRLAVAGPSSAQPTPAAATAVPSPAVADAAPVPCGSIADVVAASRTTTGSPAYSADATIRYERLDGPGSASFTLTLRDGGPVMGDGASIGTLAADSASIAFQRIGDVVQVGSGPTGDERVSAEPPERMALVDALVSIPLVSDAMRGELDPAFAGLVVDPRGTAGPRATTCSIILVDPTGAGPITVAVLVVDPTTRLLRSVTYTRRDVPVLVSADVTYTSAPWGIESWGDVAAIPVGPDAFGPLVDPVLFGTPLLVPADPPPASDTAAPEAEAYPRLIHAP